MNKKGSVLTMILWGLIMISLGVISASITMGKIFRAESETTYEEYVKEWNENIRSGIFGYRINDEKLVVRIHELRLRFVDDIQGGITFITSDSGYKKVTYIDTTTQEVRTEWIRANLIKPTHSNWGLTQDVWALDRRLAEIEGKGMGISDNPLKPIKKEEE